MQSRHVSRVINADHRSVYTFVADPGNLPKWATGLTNADVQYDGGDLIVDSPMGRVLVRFVSRNEFGVADHDVTLPSGTTVNNPLRVLSHPLGSEVVFTVRQIELSDEEFERDCDLVANDLDRLKTVFEQ